MLLTSKKIFTVAIVLTASTSSIVQALVKDQKVVVPSAQDPVEALLPMLGGLLAVLAFIFILAFIAKKFSKFSAQSNLIKVIETNTIGHKEKLSIVGVGDDYFLIGITANSIQQIGKLNPENIISTNNKEKAREDHSRGFNNMLSKFMTGDLSKEILSAGKMKRTNANSNNKRTTQEECGL